jgi:hypothetical protein
VSLELQRLSPDTIEPNFNPLRLMLSPTIPE